MFDSSAVFEFEFFFLSNSFVTSSMWHTHTQHSRPMCRFLWVFVPIRWYTCILHRKFKPIQYRSVWW